MGKLFIFNNGLPFSRLADILDGIIITVLFIYTTLLHSMRLTDANLQIKILSNLEFIMLYVLFKKN
tara:strand:+ start:49 stop:246 length:198 start_codon:yes stop_codon:yes gene_type:complete